MRQIHGFTLVELVVVVVIVGIAATVAIPSFTQLVAEQRATTKANEFVSALGFARSEALKRGRPVTICASSDGSSCSDSNDWEAGWIVFNDEGPNRGTVEGSEGEDVIRVQNGFDAATLADKSVNAAEFIPFAGDGSVDNGNSLDFELKPRDCEGDKLRGITVAPTGRAEVDRRACP